jgi:4-amino-4-deoxy-L-arabinose transferase-like glycosyltransferase
MLDRFASIPPGMFTPDGKRLSGHAYLFLVLLCLAFFLPGFATLPPTDRDESLFAQASKQMIETGNYADIRFQDQPRYRKPVGIYWLQAASAKLLNPRHLDEIWAYRVPSLIGASVAVVMTASLGALLFGPVAGLLAAIMMAGCFILNVEARLAKTDAALLGSIMVAQYALARAYMFRRNTGLTPREPANDANGFGWGVPCVFWTAIGAGLLLKGPVILLVVLSTLLWLRLTEKNLAWFAHLRPLIGIPYMLLLVAPWFVTIMLTSHGQFLEQSAGHDLLGKLWRDEGRGFIPPGAYLLAFPVSFFPFALWPILAVPDSWINRRQPEVRFCLGWIIPVWIVFELTFVKLPHYVMPVYPAIAMLAARALLDGFPALARRRLIWLPPVAISLWMMAGTGIALAAAFLPWLLDHAWNNGQIAAGLLLIIAQGASLMLFFRRRESGVIVMAAGSLVFMVSLFAAALPHLQHLWMSREIVQTAEILKPCAGPARIVSAYNEPSLVFIAGTGTILHNDGQAIADDMKEDPCRIGVVGAGQRDDFLKPFVSARMRPQPVASLHAFVLPEGRMRDITLFLMPKKGGAR